MDLFDSLLSLLWRICRDPLKSKLSPAILFLIGFVVFTLYRAWRVRIHHRGYSFQADDKKAVFISKLGTFVVNREDKLVKCDYGNGKSETISFADIRNVEIITEDIDALMQELVFEGFDPFIDTVGEYRDVVKKYSIAIVTKSFKRYPLMITSQYFVKDFLNIGYEFQLSILLLLRLYVPIDIYNQEAYEKFKTFLGREFRFDRE